MSFVTMSLAAGPGPGSHAQCPPSLSERTGPRTCAKLYDKSDPYYDNCCQGAELSLEPGTDLPYLPSGWANTASSLVVAQSSAHRVVTPGQERQNPQVHGQCLPAPGGGQPGIFGHWSNVISGLYCKCVPSPPAQPPTPA
uniref:Syncollin n=1 Tax=Castor canadensis TaxID=51338 RepID=A0A8C0WFE2_CASCN